MQFQINSPPPLEYEPLNVNDLAFENFLAECNHDVFLAMEALMTGGGQIKRVFDEHNQGLKIDARFFRMICEMEAHFVNKKPEHIEFFGGTTTGVQTVRFTNLETEVLFVDVLKLDNYALQDDLYALRDVNGEPVIRQEWMVSRDVFNLTSIWLVHALHHAQLLTPEQRKEGKIRVIMYLLYKFMTSRLFMHFKRPADPDVAAATYAQLSNKYTLKRLGSWGATIRDLATKAVDEHGIWASTIDKLDDDYAVIRMINDIQGRIRDMLKNIYDEHLRCLRQGQRITKSSANVEIDGESILKDKTKSLAQYTRYLHSVIPDRNSFIRDELLDVVEQLMPSMNPKYLMQTLQWCSNNIMHTADLVVETCVDLTMEHAFDYLEANRMVARQTKDLAGMLAKLRGAYTSSRSVDPRLMTLREKVEQLVRFATNSKNDSAVAATRTGVMLYFTLRALTMRHYSSK